MALFGQKKKSAMAREKLENMVPFVKASLFRHDPPHMKSYLSLLFGRLYIGSVGMQ